MKLLSFLSDFRKKSKVYISTESLLNETKLQLGNVVYLLDQLQMSNENAYKTQKQLKLNGVLLGIDQARLISILGEPDTSFKKELKEGKHSILFYQKSLSGFRMNIRFHFWDRVLFMGESIYEEVRNPYEFRIDKMIYKKYINDKKDQDQFFNKLEDIDGNLMYISRSVGFRVLYLYSNQDIKNAIENEIQITKSNKENSERILEEKLFDSL